MPNTCRIFPTQAIKMDRRLCLNRWEKSFWSQTMGPYPEGVFRLSEIIYIERSHFALKGEGEKTVLYYPRPMKFLPTPPQMSELSEYLIRFDKRQREPKHNIDLPFSLYAWSGGYIWTQVPKARGKAYLDKYDRPTKILTSLTQGNRGDKHIQVDEASLIKVGQVYKIEWYNKDGEQGGLLNELYGDRAKYAHLGSHHWNYPNRALVTQMTRVKSVQGNTITLSDPLLLDANPNWEAKLVDWPHIEDVSIQDLKIAFPNGPAVAHHVEDGYNAIYLTGLYDSFVKNIIIENSDSGILNDDNANVTIENILTTGAHKAHYTVHMGAVYNVLAKNLRIENQAIHPLSFNTYSVKSVYQNCEIFQSPLLDQHSGANHQNLFDNIKVHLELDDSQDTYPLFSGGGAKYWKPSHGRYSTFFNINVQVSGGDSSNNITLRGPKDGVQARLLNIYGNRDFIIKYGPDAHIEQLNRTPFVPSLYELQLKNRMDGELNAPN